MAFPGSLWKGIKVFVLFCILSPWLVWIVAFHESLHYYSCYQGVEQMSSVALAASQEYCRKALLSFVCWGGRDGEVCWIKRIPQNSSTGAQLEKQIMLMDYHLGLFIFDNRWLHIVFKCATVRSATLLNVRNLVWMDGWALLGLWNAICDTAELLAVCGPN